MENCRNTPIRSPVTARDMRRSRSAPVHDTSLWFSVSTLLVSLVQHVMSSAAEPHARL